jgi:L-alanine-DL-glutamate epimerase-like enolase superfamily enzyme
MPSRRALADLRTSILEALMRIAAIDLFYLAMPEITRAADGTQDSLLVRIQTDDGLEGWGECDASPLVTMAAYVCPSSHGNIINLREILLGERVEDAGDILRLHAKVLRHALDIEQRHHALSGADIALWDLVGKRQQKPVWRLLAELEGDAGARSQPKLPYASVLFEDTPEATRERARELRRAGFRAAKFGWGPLGRFDADFDEALVRAAREGLGSDAILCVDAGVAWGEDHQTALDRASTFARYQPHWLEEPLLPDAVEAYAKLQAEGPPVDIAAGEGCNTLRAAADLIDNGAVDYIQIDAGRIGGITTAHQVRLLAERRGITYVNHTFKSRLSLAAAIHVFAAVEDFELLEYPAGGSELARGLARGPLDRGPDGLVRAPEAPGLGVEVDLQVLKRHLVPVRIEVGGGELFRAP